MNSQAEEIVIQSSLYGELRPQTHQLYTLAKGLLGFQELRDFALLPLDNSPFFILHALDGDTSFVLIPANETIVDFGFTIDQETIELLQISKPDEVVAMFIVNAEERQLYANMKAPILFAPEQRIGCQFVIMDRDYPLRYLLNPKENGPC